MLILYPRKDLGQNFLNSHHYAQRMVEYAGIRGEVVLEIGAGKGALTKYLGDYASIVYAVEIDPRLIDELRSRAAANTVILNQDFLKINLVDYQNPVIVGNIPYPISTRIFEKLAYESNLYKKAVITVQKEFYDRMLAPIRSKRYGPLSIMTAYFFNVIKGFEIPGRFFRPSPKVASVVIALDGKKESYRVKDVKNLFSFIKDCFRCRRKSVGKLLPARVQKKLIQYLAKRPQELSLEQWVEIYNLMASSRYV